MGESQHSAWETIQREPCHRQRRVCRGDQPDGTRRDAAGRHRILGRQLLPAIREETSLGRCSHDREETLVLACDLEMVDTMRTHWPFLRDRRLDAYQDLTHRYLD